MLIRVAEERQTRRFAALNKAGEIHMRGQVDLTRACQRIRLSLMRGISGQGAADALGPVVFLARESVVQGEQIPTFDPRRGGIDPMQGSEVHLRFVVAWDEWQVPQMCA